jgi:hypothetical protein
MFQLVFKPEHPLTLTTRHELATNIGKSGNAEQAREMLMELLPIRERVLGPNHLDTILTRQELALWDSKYSESVNCDS